MVGYSRAACRLLEKSPLPYFQSLRVERAVHLLKPAAPASIKLPHVSETPKARLSEFFCVGGSRLESRRLGKDS